MNAWARLAELVRMNPGDDVASLVVRGRGECHLSTGHDEWAVVRVSRDGRAWTTWHGSWAEAAEAYSAACEALLESGQ